MTYYQITLMNPKVLIGMFLGSRMAFVFCGLPDYARCVEISTKNAQKAMLFPSLLAIIVPAVTTGVISGVSGVAGFPREICMANAGGAWDNAKKYAEESHLGGCA